MARETRQALAKLAVAHLQRRKAKANEAALRPPCPALATSAGARMEQTPRDILGLPRAPAGA